MLIFSYPYTFNYNIIVKINNGPIKYFFYKDDCNYERYLDVRIGIKKLIKILYEREFEIEITPIPDIIENKDKYIGKEIIINNGCFIIK